MKPIIVVDNVFKKYSINSDRHRSYHATDLFRELFGRRNGLELRADEFFAVNGVSLHLYPGESFALVGRNGSGKTTLLKMMNGLIKPDGGTILLEGRVQALINLGAGFNPALTGRDNIFNSAAFMGLSRRETEAIVGEVIEFSELEEFIDTPVQNYSQGMHARLGFSVAIHLKPNILLIDEILAVGDHAFQNKCFARLGQLKKDGVTIVLVTHSHTNVVQLCERALWLHRGKAMQIGPAQEVTKAYLAFLDEQEAERLRKQQAAAPAPAAPKGAAQTAESGPAPARRAGGESLYGPVYDEMRKIEDFQFAFGSAPPEGGLLRMHDRLEIEYSFRLREETRDLNVSLAFYREDGLHVSTISTLNGDLLKHVRAGRVRARVTIPDLNLAPGRYVLVMPIHEGKSYLFRDVVRRFVVAGDGGMSWGVVDFASEYRILEPGE